MSSTCKSCGTKYKVDLIIPDNMWSQISPRTGESGLICGSCIMEALEDLGEYASYHLVENAPKCSVDGCDKPSTKKMRIGMNSPNGIISDVYPFCDAHWSDVNCRGGFSMGAHVK